MILCSYSFAADWKYIGYSTLENSDTFYVFVDEIDNKNSLDNKFILEKHVFNTQQILDENTIYMTALIERSLNCEQKQISNTKATMYDSNGKEIKTYIQNDNINIEPIIITNNINYAVFREFCLDN